MGSALSAIDQGFEVYVVTDTCGDITDETHELAMERRIQCDIRPMTSMQYLLELQLDWAHVGTYETVKRVVAIGGKKMRGARQTGSHETALQVLSAYAHEAGSVIDQRCVDGKSNEIEIT